MRIANNGSLALKYQLDIVAESAVSELADVIDVYYYQGGNAAQEGLPANFGELDTTKYKPAGTLRQVLARENGAANGHLEAGTAGNPTYDYAIIALHMREEAGNEYKGLSIGTTFDIVLKATQYTSEKDGFGNADYDAGAEYAMATADEFIEALENAKPGDTITMADDLVINQAIAINKPITIQGKGTIDGGSAQYAVNVQVPGVVLKGITVASDAGTVAAVHVQPGASLTMDGCTVTGSRKAMYINGGNGENPIVVRNCTFDKVVNIEGAGNTANHVTVEKNTFNIGAGMNAITLSGNLTDVKVLDNDFNGYELLGNNYSTGVRVYGNSTPYPVFQDVVIENNRYDMDDTDFVTVDAGAQSAIDAAVASGDFLVQNNTKVTF